MSVESVGKSLHVCASVLTGQGPYSWAVHSTLQSSSKSPLRSPFFFLILTVLQIHSLVFHVHSSRPSSSGSGKRTLHRKKKRKNPGALQRVSLEDLAEQRSAQACEENNHSWSRKTSRRMRENSAWCSQGPEMVYSQQRDWEDAW